MPDSDIDLIVSVVDGILSDITKQPQLKPCVLPDGWIPIASLLNYTHLGRSVWPFGGVGVVADCLAARNSSVSELSGDNSCVRNKPMRVRLRHSLEFIFSDSNFHKDVHLQLLQEADGFTPLHLILSTYSQLQQLLQHVAPLPGVDPKAHQAAVVAEALESSSELVLRPPQPDVAPFGAARRKTLPERVVQQARRPPPTTQRPPPAAHRPHAAPRSPTRPAHPPATACSRGTRPIHTYTHLCGCAGRVVPRGQQAGDRSLPRRGNTSPPPSQPVLTPPLARAFPLFPAPPLPTPTRTRSHLPPRLAAVAPLYSHPSPPVQTAKDHDGWVPIGTLLAFPRMRKLCHPQAHTHATLDTLDPSPPYLCRPLAPPRTPSHPLAPPRTPLHPLGRWRRWLTCSHDLRSSRYPRTRLA